MPLLETHTPTPADHAVIEAKAEAVRAYLVELRGGAPFLSGADSRLLVRWLEAGISVALILAALDVAAERRRKRRGKGKPARSRLTLSAARSAIEKRARDPVVPRAAGLDTWSVELQAMETEPVLAEAKARLVADVGAIPCGDPDGVARAAIEACRDFQAAAWATAEVERAGLQADARAQLGALESILDAGAFQAAVEEVARDMVHARFPLVSAKVVWDRLTAGGQE